MSTPRNFLADRVWVASLYDFVNRLLIEISKGKEPPPSKHEWRTLKAHWQGKLNRRGVGNTIAATSRERSCRHCSPSKRSCATISAAMADKKRDRLSLDAYAAKRAHAQMTAEWNAKLAKRWGIDAPPSAKQLLNWLKNSRNK